MSRYLEMVDSPMHVKKLTLEQLQQLAEEIRHELITVLAKNGGHLGPNLGVVELTLALHRVFDTPKDKFLWDVSHQVYVHKLLTGRKSRFNTIRSTGGLSGFALRTESEHDCYGAAHAGTALSAALGICAARDQRRERRGDFRRRGADQRNFVRGDEQHRKHNEEVHRHPQRQRMGHCQERRRHLDLPQPAHHPPLV
jgi:deoxyxylulose-5-phosphate synthase